MIDFDATHAWLEVDGKKIFELSDDYFFLRKDNSKENQEMLLQDFKRRLSQTLAPDVVISYNTSYKKIPERDY